MDRFTGCWMIAACCMTLPLLAAAQVLHLSPDTTVVLGGVTAHDEAIADDDGAGGITLAGVGTLPAATDVSAYHRLPDGSRLMAFDTTIVLGGITFEPGDVARFDGTTYTLEFDASAAGVPAGVYVDAVSMDGAGQLLLSFDTTLQHGALTIDDADLVTVDGTTFSLLFDSVGAGVADGLDLDAAHLRDDGFLLVSFDGSGTLGGVSFDDEDVLEYDLLTGTWAPFYRGAIEHAGWATADLDAFSVGESSGGGCTPAPDPDLTGDGLVNILDISTIAACFFKDPLTLPACAIADTNCDGNVDYVDLSFVISSFGQSGF